MAVAVLAVTHGRTGETLLETARAVLGGELSLKARAFSVPLDCDTEAAVEQLRRDCRELDEGDGVLILGDLYGSTPCNVSALCCHVGKVHAVSGINLSMLIKIMNYPTLDLETLTAKALEGGRGGVMECGR